MRARLRNKCDSSLLLEDAVVTPLLHAMRVVAAACNGSSSCMTKPLRQSGGKRKEQKVGEKAEVSDVKQDKMPGKVSVG